MEDHFLTPETERLPRRDQNSSNLCWAFTALTCFELKLLKKYPQLPADKLLFSRTHMRYSCYQNFPAQESRTWGAQLRSSSGIDTPGSDRPITQQLVNAYFSRESGPVYGFMEPFQGTNIVTMRTFDQIETDMTKAWQVSSFAEIDDAMPTSARILKIKEAVKEHGAVAASIYYDDIYMKDNEYYFSFPSKTASKNENPNHAVSIVGWDDRTVASMFSAQSIHPVAPGAFLVRDSAISKNQGKNNYYYVSYEDSYIVGYNYYIKEIRPWYTAMHCYQHNYFGSMFSSNTNRNYTNQKRVTKVFYDRAKGKAELTDSVLFFNSVRDTQVSAFIGLPQSSGGFQEQQILSDKTLSFLGYEIFTADTPVTIPADADRFYLKVIYRRNSALKLPMESDGQQRGSSKFAKNISELPSNTEFLVSQISGNMDYDLSSSTNRDVFGRLTYKLFTKPVSSGWDAFCTYADQYTVPASLGSAPNNLAVTAPTAAVWEVKQLDQDITGLELSGCSLINKTSASVETGLHGTFTNDGFKIDRFYYTTVLPASVILNKPDAPGKGISTFQVSGSAPYAGKEVRILLYATGKSGNEIGKGITDAQGIFCINCNYMGYGSVELQAEVEKMQSNICTLEIEKSYDEKEDTDPKDPKKKRKKYDTTGSNGLDQALRAATLAGLLGFACYVYYKARMDAPRRAGYELVNTELIHLHVDAINAQALNAEADELFFPGDLPADYVFIKSMTNSSISESDLNAGPEVTLVETMDQKSYLKNCRIKRTLKPGSPYTPVVGTLNGGEISNCSLDIQAGVSSVSGSFAGFINQMKGGKIDGLKITLPEKLVIAETFSGAAAALSDGALISNCTVAAPSVAASNGAGVSFTSEKAQLTDCSFTGNLEMKDRGAGLLFEALVDNTVIRGAVKGSIRGKAAGGIVGYAMRKLMIDQCLVSGTVDGTDLAAGILASMRPIEGANDSLIKNCLSLMDCVSEQGYAGGIAGMCGIGSDGVKIENCLSAGNVQNTVQGTAGTCLSAAGGIAAQAQSAQSCAVLSNQISGSHAVLSAGTAENSLYWNDIALPDESKTAGWSAADSQSFFESSGWSGLSWDFNNIWVFTSGKYPFLKAFAQQAADFYPFLYIKPNQPDGSCRFGIGESVILQGTYPDGVTDIAFSSCSFLGNDQLLLNSGAGTLRASEQAWSLTFGTLSVGGKYEFTISYKQSGIVHKARIRVNIEKPSDSL